MSRQKDELKIFVNNLYNIFSSIKSWFFEININISHLNNEEKYELARDVTKQGNFISVRCGHNGALSGSEALILSRIIESSNK